MRKKSKDSIIIGLALFAMFFGAGNLIFPPSIGFASASQWPLSMLGFFLTGIGMPLLGILAVTISGGSLKTLTSKVNNKFYMIFGSLVILLIGPMIAIPRTGATAFEMGILPNFSFINSYVSAFLFFGVTLLLTIKPTGIIDRIGKFLTPVLLTMLSIIIIKGIMNPIGQPAVSTLETAFSFGFTQGYQTMDLLGAIVFGALITTAVREKGYNQRKDSFHVTAKAALIAAFGLLTIYGGLLYLGATGSNLLVEQTKAQLIIDIVYRILGISGQAILGLGVYAACLTTSVGLTATVGNFFSELTNHKLSYRLIVILTTIISAVASTTGVETIVSFASPILVVIYPMAIVLVVLNVFDNFIAYQSIYKGALFGTFSISFFDGLKAAGVQMPSTVNSFIESLPLFSIGFGWLLPAVIGSIIIVGYSKLTDNLAKSLK